MLHEIDSRSPPRGQQTYEVFLNMLWVRQIYEVFLNMLWIRLLREDSVLVFNSNYTHEAGV